MPASEQLAIYPGSFDPITNGHLDLIRRASKILDHVVVATLRHDTKDPLFTTEERMEMITQATADLPNVSVDNFDGLLVDYAREHGARLILRGIRAVSDYEYELQMALMNRQLSTELETLFIPASEQYSYLSSRIVKEVSRLGGDVSALVPALVSARLIEKHSNL
jgi:pantetheine-phosphate adenylyltransferase